MLWQSDYHSRSFSLIRIEMVVIDAQPSMKLIEHYVEIDLSIFQRKRITRCAVQGQKA